MTTPGDAFYSPVPQSEPPSFPTPQLPSPAAPWAAPGGPTASPQHALDPRPSGQPDPLGHPAPPSAPYRPVRPRRRGSRLWILVTAAVVLVVLGGAIALGQFVSNDTKVVADGQHRVSLRMPRTWVDYTEPDPDSAADPDEEDYEVPDLEVSSAFGGSDLVAYLDPAGGGGLTEAHRLALDDECEFWTCLERGAPQPVIIDGQPGLEQVVTHFDDDEGAAVTVLLTVQHGDLVVSASATRYSMGDDPPAPDQLIAVLHTLSFTR